MDVNATCQEIQAKYSACDISDALLTLKVPGAGHLADIHPFPHDGQSIETRFRLVAPISTVLFVPKSFNGSNAPSHIPSEKSLPQDEHWTDVAPPGSIALLQMWTPENHPEIVAGLLGDIVATRYKKRGVRGAVVDGRSRDVTGVSKLCRDGEFQAWTRALTSVGTSLEAKPWAVNVPLKVGQITVAAGDIICADAAERVLAVIPQDRLQEVANLLTKLKKADDEVLKDVVNGVNLRTSFANHPDHYTHHN